MTKWVGSGVGMETCPHTHSFQIRLDAPALADLMGVLGLTTTKQWNVNVSILYLECLSTLRSGFTNLPSKIYLKCMQNFSIV